MSDSSSSPGIHLGQDIADAVNNALENGVPIIATYVDGDGQPHISLRGTTQVYSEDQLALWARDANGGMPRALSNNPRVTLFYRNTETRTSYFFYGHAHVETDESVRNHIYDASPEREQKQDPDRKGAAIVVDVDVVEGRTADGPFKQTGS